MPADNQMKNMLQNMPTKQKITILATIIVVIIVIWQVVDLFGGKKSPPPAVIKPVTVKMNANTPTAAPAMNSQAMPATQSAVPPPANNVPREVALAKDTYREEQEKNQTKYLKQLSDLEQLKLERQIEETNQAIAIAKLATVTAEKNTADLLTKPVPIPPPTTAYADQLVTPASSEAPRPASMPTVEMTPDIPYTVISVSMQFNKWSAVIGSQGKLYNVTVGDILAPDGSVVTLISKTGVTLRKDNRTRRIGITTAI